MAVIMTFEEFARKYFDPRNPGKEIAMHQVAGEWRAKFLDAGPHVHDWQAPPFAIDDHAHVDEAIEFNLTGQVCSCGAARIYRGPAIGWVMLRESR